MKLFVTLLAVVPACALILAIVIAAVDKLF
jgi:hypothetical protein